MGSPYKYLPMFSVSYSKSTPISIGPNEKLLFMARTCVKYFIGDACEEGTKKVTQIDANGQPGPNVIKLFTAVIYNCWY
jgi:hypothetical protein